MNIPIYPYSANYCPRAGQSPTELKHVLSLYPSSSSTVGMKADVKKNSESLLFDVNCNEHQTENICRVI